MQVKLSKGYLLAIVFGIVSFLIEIGMVIFPGGYIPHKFKLDDGEVVVAYENGVVYYNVGTNPLMMRRLHETSTGKIISTFMELQFNATPEEVEKWRKSQEVLSKYKMRH